MGFCGLLRVSTIVCATVSVASCAFLYPVEEETGAGSEVEGAGEEIRPVPVGIADLLESIPDAEVPELDREIALSLAAMPLACGEAGEEAGGSEGAAEAPEPAALAAAEEEGGAEPAEGDESTEEGEGDSEEQRADDALRALTSKSHLIGLAFLRAEAMNEIAAALPSGDARAHAYRELAALHGQMGFEAMFEADYAGSHWIGTFALKYLLTSRR